MTKSRVSPNGKIAKRDVGSKLVIIMVGLPARGKSYITKKMKRYLHWQQHSVQIFNVGNRRRIAAGSVDLKQNPPHDPTSDSPPASTASGCSSVEPGEIEHAIKNLHIRTTSIPGMNSGPNQAAQILLNGVNLSEHTVTSETVKLPSATVMEQNAEFFDPNNERASNLREQLAVSTMDELLDFLLLQDGSVGILDATNSTIERRSILFKQVKAREPKLGILFIESYCQDPKVS
jgi:6-phosphofructo-2-kinase